GLAVSCFAVGNPNVFDVSGGSQKLLAGTLFGVKPVPRTAVVDPGALEVARGGPFDHCAALGGAEVPDGVHVVVFGQDLEQGVPVSGDDIDDAGGHVGGV